MKHIFSKVSLLAVALMAICFLGGMKPAHAGDWVELVTFDGAFSYDNSPDAITFSVDDSDFSNSTLARSYSISSGDLGFTFEGSYNINAEYIGLGTPQSQYLIYTKISGHAYNCTNAATTFFPQDGDTPGTTGNRDSGELEDSVYVPCGQPNGESEPTINYDTPTQFVYIDTVNISSPSACTAKITLDLYPDMNNYSVGGDG